LGIIGTVTLQGGGELLLVDDNSHIDNISNGAITNVDNLIHGSGNISVPVTNQNIIRADGGPLSFSPSLDNSAANARVEVENGATLSVGGSLNGLLVVEPGGLVDGTLSNATSPGTLTVSGSGGYILLTNTFTNQGKVTFAGLGQYDRLGIIGTVTLQGGGELLLIDGNSH
jgi:hypothetical protein